MRDGFTPINLRPLTFDPVEVDVGQQLVGHAFAVEPHDDGAAIVVKLTEQAHAFDPSTGRVVIAPIHYAVRVVAKGALQRLLARVIDLDTGRPRDVVPCLCFEVVELRGVRALVVGEQPAAAVPRHAFMTPTMLDTSTLTPAKPAAVDVKPAKGAKPKQATS